MKLATVNQDAIGMPTHQIADRRRTSMQKATAVDLFAGAGGFTTGARAAGVKVLWCANHWQIAVDTHEQNHPDSTHLCQDLHQANWEDVPFHDMLLASPACTGHTNARGKERSHHDAARSTAWAVVSCAEAKRPEVLIIENVPEFLSWVLYPAFADALSRLGYSLSPMILDAADFGVPQHRVRLFIIATRSRHPISLHIKKRPHVHVRSIIEWERWNWSPIEKPGRSQKTLQRVANARKEFGPRFVMPYYSSGSGLTGRSLDRPIGTITTVDRWAIVDDQKMRMFQPTEYRLGMGFPADYWLPKTRSKAIHLLGNAVCPPMACDIIRETLAVA